MQHVSVSAKFQPGDHVWVKNLGVTSDQQCVAEQKCILIRGDKSTKSVEEERMLFVQYLFDASRHQDQATLPLQFDKGTHIKITQINLSDSNNVKWTLDRNFSVSMWIKRTSDHSSGCLISKSDDKKNGWQLTLNENGSLEFGSLVGGHEISVTTALSRQCYLKLNKWYHVCATCSHIKEASKKITCQMKLWVDGGKLVKYGGKEKLLTGKNLFAAALKKDGSSVYQRRLPQAKTTVIVATQRMAESKKNVQSHHALLVGLNGSFSVGSSARQPLTDVAMCDVTIHNGALNSDHVAYQHSHCLNSSLSAPEQMPTLVMHIIGVLEDGSILEDSPKPELHRLSEQITTAEAGETKLQLKKNTRVVSKVRHDRLASAFGVCPKGHVFRPRRSMASSRSSSGCKICKKSITDFRCFTSSCRYALCQSCHATELAKQRGTSVQQNSNKDASKAIDTTSAWIRNDRGTYIKNPNFGTSTEKNGATKTDRPLLRVTAHRGKNGDKIARMPCAAAEVDEDIEQREMTEDEPLAWWVCVESQPAWVTATSNSSSSSLEEEKPQTQWPCHTCTFMNLATAQVCAVCTARWEPPAKANHGTWICNSPGGVIYRNSSQLDDVAVTLLGVVQVNEGDTIVPVATTKVMRSSVEQLRHPTNEFIEWLVVLVPGHGNKYLPIMSIWSDESTSSENSLFTLVDESNFEGESKGGGEDATTAATQAKNITIIGEMFVAQIDSIRPAEEHDGRFRSVEEPSTKNRAHLSSRQHAKHLIEKIQDDEERVAFYIKIGGGRGAAGVSPCENSARCLHGKTLLMWAARHSIRLFTAMLRDAPWSVIPSPPDVTDTTDAIDTTSWSWDSSWTILHELVDVRGEMVEQEEDQLRDIALRLLLEKYDFYEQMSDGRWNCRDVEYLTLQKLTELKHIRDGPVSCGWHKQTNGHRDRMVQHRGKNGRRGPYGQIVKKEDVHVLTRTLAHVVKGNSWSMRVVPGQYEVEVTYGDVAFDKPATLYINNQVLILNDRPGLGVRTRSLIVDVSDPRPDARIVLASPATSKNKSTRICTVVITLITPNVVMGPRELWGQNYGVGKSWKITFRPNENQSRHAVPPTLRGDDYDEPLGWTPDTGSAILQPFDRYLDTVPRKKSCNRYTAFFLQRASHLCWSLREDQDRRQRHKHHIENKQILLDALHYRGRIEMREEDVELYRGSRAETGVVGRGTTALHVACKNGRSESVRILLQHGATPALQDEVGASPLHYCAASGSLNLVLLFLNSGSRLMEQDDNGDLASDYALDAASRMENGLVQDSKTTLQLRCLYDIAAMLESEAHTSQRICRITFLGLFHDNSYAGSSRDEPGRKVMSNEFFPPRILECKIKTREGVEVGAKVGKVIGIDFVSTNSSLSNDLLHVGRRVLTRNATHAFYGLTCKKGALQEANSIVVSQHHLDIDPWASTSMYRRYGEVAKTHSLYKASVFQVKTEDGFRSLPFGVVGDSIHCVGAEKTIAVYKLDFSSFEIDTRVQKNDTLHNDATEKRRIKTQTQRLNEEQLLSVVPKGEMKAENQLPPRAPSSSQVPSVQVPTILSSSGNSASYEQLQESLQHPVLWNGVDTIECGQKYETSLFFVQEKKCAATKKEQQKADYAKWMKSTIFDARRLSRIFTVGEKETVPDIVHVTAQVKNAPYCNQNQMMLLVHLRPLSEPPFLRGGGLKKNQFLGLKYGYVWQLKTPISLLNYCDMGKGYYRSDLLDDEVWLRRNTKTNQVLIGSQWFDNTLYELNSRMEKKIADTTFTEQWMPFDGKMRRGTFGEGPAAMGYFTPGEERSAGGFLELYSQWCSEGVGKEESPLSLFDQLETDDVVELWIFTGKVDSRAGGKISIYQLNIALGYQQIGRAPDEHLLDRQQTDELANLRDTMTGASETVASALQIPVSWAELLLETYKWRPATAVSFFEKDPEAACLEAGLPYRKLYRARQLASDGAVGFGLRQPTIQQEEIPSMLDLQPADHCLICYEESNPPASVLRGLGCGHIFCDDCWKNHVDTLMLKGDVVNLKKLRCPMYTIGCETRIPHDVIEEVASERAKQLYDTLVVREFVTDHSKVLRWCPGVGCECVVERFRRRLTQDQGKEATEQTTAEITKAAQSSVVNFNSVHCSVNFHFFCFECFEAPHDPVSCEMYSDWLNMVELGTGVDPRTGTSDQQALNRLSEIWVQQNTRKCPSCNLAILKADGCNHMTCRNPKCNHQWCWICRKNWSSCGGTYNVSLPHSFLFVFFVLYNI